MRVGKLSVAELPGAIAHNQREVQPLNADPQLLSRNVDFLKDDKRSVLERWTARIEACGNVKIRTNAVAAVELFMGFSPEAADRIDSIEWGKDCAAFAARIFGAENTISQVLHRDEKTDHCSTLSVPLIKKSIRGKEPEWRLSASDWTDGPVKMRKLQTMFWEQVGQKYGLERGEEGSVRKHIPQSAMYQESNKVETVVADAIRSIPETNPSHSVSERDARLKAHLEKHLATLSEAAKQVALVQSANRAAIAADLRQQKESERRRKAEEERSQAQDETARLRKEHEVRLRSLPVSSVLQHILGVQPRREGNQRVFETPHQKIIVHPDEKKFAIFKGDERGGSGAISAVMQATGCDFQQATRWLASHFGRADVESTIRVTYERVIQRYTKEALDSPMTLEEKLRVHAPIVEANWASVREYLTRIRLLPGSWIDALHQRGNVWSNHQSSACFAHRDHDGTITGASIRGKFSKFHQTIGSKASGFFKLSLRQHSCRQIAVVESPIEAISLACLRRIPQTVYASTAGAGGLQPLLELARRSKLTVLAAQNDDAAGSIQAEQTAAFCNAHAMTCVRLRPPFPDWNDTLRFMSAEMQRVLKHDDLAASHLRAAWQRSMHRQICSQSKTNEDLLNLTKPTNNQNTTIIL